MAICKMGFRVWGVFAAMLMAGCQVQPLRGEANAASPAAKMVAATSTGPARIAIDVPVAWGGEIRCGSAGCLLGAVEHENGYVAVHRLEGRRAHLLDRQRVAYHPDSAVWLADDLLAAAVEATASIDVFKVVNERLVRVQRIVVDFSPRDVVLVQASQGRYLMLATPYSGKNVAWIDWTPDSGKGATVKKVRWCEAAWHPVRVSKVPGMVGPGVAVACLDDRKVIAVPESDVLAQPRVIAQFPAISRYARPSPSGQWLYVSLETGGRNARIHMESGELQWIQSPLTGSIAVAPLSDDLVIWSEDRQLYLQRLDFQGAVLETRWIKAGGFATGLQLIDVDGDGERDLVVTNSSEDGVDVIFGPLWEQAERKQQASQH